MERIQATAVNIPEGSKRLSVLFAVAIGAVGSISFGAISMFLRIADNKQLNNESERFIGNTMIPNTVAFFMTLLLLFLLGSIRNSTKNAIKMIKAYSLAKSLSILWSTLMFSGLAVSKIMRNNHGLNMAAAFLIVASMAIVIFQLFAIYQSMRIHLNAGRVKSVILVLLSLIPIMIASSVYGKLSPKEISEIEAKTKLLESKKSATR